VDSLEVARAEQARSAPQLNAIRAEDLRIPITIVLQVHDEIFQALARILPSELFPADLSAFILFLQPGHQRLEVFHHGVEMSSPTTSRKTIRA
jgi:hypothetical protein